MPVSRIVSKSRLLLFDCCNYKWHFRRYVTAGDVLCTRSSMQQCIWKQRYKNEFRTSFYCDSFGCSDDIPNRDSGILLLCSKKTLKYLNVTYEGSRVGYSRGAYSTTLTRISTMQTLMQL